MNGFLSSSILLFVCVLIIGRGFCAAEERVSEDEDQKKRKSEVAFDRHVKPEPGTHPAT